MVVSPGQGVRRVAAREEPGPAEETAATEAGRPGAAGRSAETIPAAETGAVAAKAIATTRATGALSPEDLRLIDQLSATDRQVRAHELAHMAAGAGLTGGATFTYQVGPDNQRYAVGGEVGIDTSPAADPEETIAKAQQIRAAALAPADPSSQDQKVAAMAAQMASVARLQLAAQERAQNQTPAQESESRISAAAAAYQSVAAAGDDSSAASRAAGFRAFA
ncbi:putative metalloprotease CJM1_0395 family protein [Candidatus Accumulibacter sp. ACC007]|uniref:putative metalloprotease CJM1_0395 family protein n=1 Tax=Candidatus Accumulibacter sp. ACC007 TaxID=2823333 RepID=UPI0025C582A3|nr:putative metalloprotease CJM1_0395 family protein [Candidatus Accumulibacter sp. ACC007]